MSENHTYQRFDVGRRVEHLILILSFTLLALTGLPQKFPTWGVSDFIINFFGGIETARIIHRVSAVVFILQSVYHLLLMGYKLYVLREKATMGIGVKDAKDAFHAFFYNLGIAKTAPKMGRYNFVEKMEYWAMAWGLIAMGLTGIMLWNPISTAKILPGEFIPAAKTMHGLEAILAVLAIIIWHFYSVHLRNFNKSMINGKISMEEMEEDHILELEEAEKNPYVRPSAKDIKKRATIFAPIAVVIALVSLFAMYKIAFSEQSALTTLPPQEREVVVYAPQTPTPSPTKMVVPTPIPQAKLESWTDLGPLFGKCKACHGSMGGLSLKTYADLLKGGKSGAAILPGDSAGSLLVTMMEGGHQSGAWSTEDLARVKAWIDAGAPETVEAQPPSGPATWDSAVGAIMGKCVACHGAMGGLSLASYADAIQGGASGAAIVPGDAPGSLLIQKVEGGHQTDKWTPEDLQIIKDWIQAGALEK